MAQQFNVMQSLFGLSPESVQSALVSEEQKRIANAPTGLTGLSQELERANIGLEKGVQSLLGIQDPRLLKARTMSEALQSSAPAYKEGGMVGLMREYANQLESRGLINEAAQARASADAQEMSIDKNKAEVFKETSAGIASLAAAGREKRVPLADRLVELDTKKATVGLTAPEESERTALERVVSIQAPKAPAGETEEAKAIGKGSGEQFIKVTTTDLDLSEKKMRAVRELQVLAGQVDTGPFADIKAKSQALFKDLGVDLGNPTNAQALRAAIERGVAQSQLEQKGVQTDRDAARYRTAGVLLSNTPEANQYIVNYQLALDQRTREKAKFFESFRDRKGTSVGAESAWNDYIKDKDIFDSPTLSKYKDLFRMNDLAKQHKSGAISGPEKQELIDLMKRYNLREVKISQ